MAKADIEISFSKEASEIIRKIQSSNFICDSTECEHHYRSKANCMRKEIKITNGKCNFYKTI